MNAEKMIFDLLAKNRELEERIEALENKKEIQNKDYQEEPYNTNKSIFINRSYEKNYDKYYFENYEYGKGRLVLAVVKAYVRDNPNVTFEELKAIFPDYIIKKPYGILQKIEYVKHKYPNDYYKRFFVKPNELIHLQDSHICVCTQWEKRYIDKFINKSISLGYEIETCGQSDYFERSISKWEGENMQNNKHSWTYDEDMYCCQKYYEYYVVNKMRTDIDEFVAMLNIDLPNIKRSSLKMKIQNIKQIALDLNLEDTLRCGPLKNYSNQNYLAMKEVIKQNRIEE